MNFLPFDQMVTKLNSPILLGWAENPLVYCDGNDGMSSLIFIKF